MPTWVKVTAASRLHFGMVSFGQPNLRQFGGVGVMVDAPSLMMRLTDASDTFTVSGPHAARVEAFARQVSAAFGNAEPPPFRIEVTSAPPEHAGLGLGTALGLSVAVGLSVLVQRPEKDPAMLARYAGRGQRSAVGTYGFARGGLIVEAGKLAADELSPLVSRVELPAPWRFVLLTPPSGAGLSGSDEQQAFRALPPVPRETTDALCRETLLHLVPAAREGRFEEFSASLYRYGHLAGSCFASVQGGPYASPRLQQLVDLLRSEGIEGVGQSSWGPTLFALLPDQDQAETLAADLRTREATRDLQLTIAAPQNRGADVVVAVD